MASIEQTLGKIFDLGTAPITIGRPAPHEKAPGGPEYFAKTMVHILTGPQGNGISAEHQGAGKTLGEAVQNLYGSVLAMDKHKVQPPQPTGILHLPGSVNGRIPKLTN